MGKMVNYMRLLEKNFFLILSKLKQHIHTIIPSFAALLTSGSASRSLEVRAGWDLKI